MNIRMGKAKRNTDFGKTDCTILPAADVFLLKHRNDVRRRSVHSVPLRYDMAIGGKRPNVFADAGEAYRKTRRMPYA